MVNKKIYRLTTAAMIAALYVLLTYLAEMFGLASSAIQVRFSEALTILPVFTSAAIPGLFAGCLLANLLTGAAFWDVVFGSLATLLGAVGTYLLRRHPYAAVLPPILANTVVVPLVLSYVYGLAESLPYLVITVCIGEILSCGVLGILLYRILRRHGLPVPNL